MRKNTEEIEPKGIVPCLLLSIVIAMLLFTSCDDSNYPMNNYSRFIVYKIAKTKSGKCLYSVTNKHVSVAGDNYFSFYDTCSKYQIGDTLKIVKQ
jgi:hypothetical protein